MGLLDIHSRLDPQMMDVLRQDARLAEEARAAVSLESADPYDLYAMRTLYNANRQYWGREKPEIANITDLSIPVEGGAISARLFHPVEGQVEDIPVILFIHGGGWVVGNLETHDRMMRLLALKSQCAVLGVAYRLAPEHKFPGPLEDCMAAIHWIRNNGSDLGVNPAKLFLAGDSAGANMSMGAAFCLQQAGIFDILKGIVLYYGAFGLRDSMSRRLWGGAEDGLSTSDLDFYRDCLFADPEHILDPRYNILANDLSGYPPIFALGVEMDPLADDTVALAASVKEAGGVVDLQMISGVLHGYLHMSICMDKAMAALDDSATFIKRLV